MVFWSAKKPLEAALQVPKPPKIDYTVIKHPLRVGVEAVGIGKDVAICLSLVGIIVCTVFNSWTLWHLSRSREGRTGRQKETLKSAFRDGWIALVFFTLWMLASCTTEPEFQFPWMYEDMIPVVSFFLLIELLALFVLDFSPPGKVTEECSESKMDFNTAMSSLGKQLGLVSPTTLGYFQAFSTLASGCLFTRYFKPSLLLNGNRTVMYAIDEAAPYIISTAIFATTIYSVQGHMWSQTRHQAERAKSGLSIRRSHLIELSLTLELALFATFLQFCLSNWPSVAQLSGLKRTSKLAHFVLNAVYIELTFRGPQSLLYMLHYFFRLSDALKPSRNTEDVRASETPTEGTPNAPSGRKLWTKVTFGICLCALVVVCWIISR